MGFADFGRAAFAAFALAAMAVAPADAAAPRRVSLSAPTLQLRPEERVKGFELVVKGGRVTALPHIPAPFRIKVSNDDDGDARVEGTALTGYASFNAALFQEFVELELKEGATIRLRVDTTTDFETIARKITIEEEQLALRPLP